MCWAAVKTRSRLHQAPGGLIVKVISNQLAYGVDNSNEDNMVAIGIWVTLLPRELSEIVCLCNKT
jgi:hypothetical protein